MVYAAEQAAENLTGAFFLILVMIAMSFMAGFGLCFILMHRRRSSGNAVAGQNPVVVVQEPPGYGIPPER